MSISVGVAALTSAAQSTPLGWLAEYRTVLCVGAIALITVANLCGVRESGALFSVPTKVSGAQPVDFGRAFYL